MRTRKPRFPSAGTDRRPDELQRNLHTEEEAAISHARAVETDRVADEDREAADHRTGELEAVVARQKSLIDTLALAVLLLLAVVVIAGFVLLF